MINWKEIRSIQSSPLNAILEKHKIVFEEGLSKMKGFEAKTWWTLRLHQSLYSQVFTT